ncbi:MAG: hypothetical protein GWN11_01405 [Candidatus Dadabacteria bacterium]|nr:hypothetical protein [Candidatus Dadabacteria bacterium]
MKDVFKERLMLDSKTNKRNCFLLYLIILVVLLVFRVAAQLMQYFFNLPFLPPFQFWDSGTLPYQILVAAQLAIIVILSKIVYKIGADNIRPNIKTGYIFITLGAVYFTIMLFRLAAGLTLLSDVKWFSYPIPPIFHMILASFLILFGYFHLIKSGGK